MKKLTSTTHPIRMDWISKKLPGHLGLTFAPGKHATSKFTGGTWERDLDLDLQRLKEEYKIGLLVCLLEDHELTLLKIPKLIETAEELGIETLRLPIPDGGTLPELGPVKTVVDSIRSRLEEGVNVVIHCQGGLGRAGTVGGCVLTSLGLSGQEALVRLAEERDAKNCPETTGQVNFILEFAEEYANVWGVTSQMTSSNDEKGDLQKRTLGCLLGAAIGDAMGHPTEFMDMASIHRKYGPQGVQDFELYWEREGERFAPYTDDTQMAEVVARVLVAQAKHGWDLDKTMNEMGKQFVEWMDDPQGGHRAPGNACLAGCRELKKGTPWSEAGGKKAGGCGSVMRAFPFGIWAKLHGKNPADWAVEHSKLTHRDPIALAACAAMATGVAHFLHGISVSVCVERMISQAATYSKETADMMRQARDEALAGGRPEVTLDRLRAWAAHEAIASAVYILVRHPDDVRAAILEGANTPGDSDSIATLAGALVGARVGIDGLPKKWVQEVERSSELSELAILMCS
ncbi:MAG: hypothetical protein GY822_14470 [Deltaproteobacteria bacterium]|nr:hypothetical protein [Deltaproteobacteria bacterium]